MSGRQSIKHKDVGLQMIPVLLLLCFALSSGYAVPLNEITFSAIPLNRTLPYDGATFSSYKPRIVGGSYVNEPIPYQVGNISLWRIILKMRNGIIFMLRSIIIGNLLKKWT